MKILVVTWIDAANLSIENIVSRMIERGHQVDIYAFHTDYKSIRMFKHLPVTIYPVSRLNKKQVQDYDIAFTVDSAMRALRFSDIYVFAYNHLPDTWVSEAPDFMFTMVNDRKLRFEEECAMMPIGCAKNDKEVVEGKYKKQILYIDAGHNPFGKNAKIQVASMILKVCKKLSDYEIIIKPRWLPSESIRQTHRSGIHIYDVINEITNNSPPANLIMLKEHKDLQKLIDESESVLTTSVSTYLDVALRKKGCIIVNGFDSEEVYDTRPAIANSYKNAEGSGCCVDYRDVINYLPHGIMCNEEHLIERIPYLNGVSDKIINVMEFIFQNFITKGLYPDIKKYNYETYQEKMTSSQKITLEDLKTKRFKNGALIIMRLQEHVKADIDKSCLYKKICSDYVKYSMDEKGYKNFLDGMEYERKLICINNESLMQTDDIDQSIYFQALYDTGRGDEFLTMNLSKVLCMGPYHYYLGMTYAKYNWIDSAMEHFVLFLEEALERSYNKYVQESDWGIRSAFNYIFKNFKDYNIKPEKLAYLCIKLSRRDITIVDYEGRKLAHNYLPNLAQMLKKEDPELAYQCLELYADKAFHYLVQEKNSEIIEVVNEINHIKNSISYKLGRTMTFPMRFVRKAVKKLRHKGVKKIAVGWAEKIRNFYYAQHVSIIWKTFQSKVLMGYDIYSKFINKYGSNAFLFLTGAATGDTYIYSMLFEAYSKKEYPNSINVIGVFGNSGIDIANLFRINNAQAYSLDEFRYLWKLSMFVKPEYVHIKSMHYHVIYRHIAILMHLEGLHGFNLLSLSEAFLGIEDNAIINPPIFDNDKNFLNDLFSKNSLIPGKTVLIAPYAKSVRQIPVSFWKKLADQLSQQGYKVCTNSIGIQEPPIEGTIAMQIPHSVSVPFLEMAGITIGLRSGFQDITNTANCLKITLYPIKNFDRSIVCDINHSYSLIDMYNRKNQYDLFYSIETEDTILQNIMDITNGLSGVSAYETR